MRKSIFRKEFNYGKNKKILVKSLSVLLSLFIAVGMIESSAFTVAAANSNEDSFCEEGPISKEDILNALSNAELIDENHDSSFIIADSSVEISDDYYPETANIYEDTSENFVQNEDTAVSSISSDDEIPGDPMVYYTQKWLNQEYGSVPGFGTVAENGKTGWDTIYGLTRALQHELGITGLANSFGPTTSSLYEKNILKRQDGVIDKKFAILQCALWCKGYNPGYNMFMDSNGTVHINAIFDETVENAIKQLQKDAGLSNQDGVVSLNIMKSLMSMDSFKLLPSSYGSDTKIRAFQQWLNNQYEAYTGLNPCDGVYGRNTNKALIKALQAEEGMPIDVATGNFGTTTTLCCPEIPYNRNSSSAAKSYPGTSEGNLYSYPNITSFTKLLQFALYVNGFGDGNCDGNFDNDTRHAVRLFQEHHAISMTGNVNKGTWLSLFISCGDKTRLAKAADCATILTQPKAKALYDSGYGYIGRYLTGTYNGGISKAITREEAEIILDAGLRFFPIYQTTARSATYFTPAQGTSDAKAAIAKAKEIGIPSGTIIYFAVDFDAMDYQITANVLPYFEKVFEEMSCDIYQTGVYGARNVCSRVSDSGYACSSFVGNMSTGFSGNLGYKMPSNWAFDQFSDKDEHGNYLTISSPDGSFYIDKDGFSGRDEGVGFLDDVDNSIINADGVSFGGTGAETLYGPTINIFGEEVPLFQLDMSFDMGFAHAESYYDKNDKTTSVIFGLDIFKGEKDTYGGREKVDEFTKAYKNVKTMTSFMNKDKAKFLEMFNDYKGSLYDTGLSIGLQFDGYFIGYMKVDEKGKLIESEMGLLCTTKISYSYPLVPAFYVKFQCEGSIQSKLALSIESSGTINAHGDITFSGKLSGGFEGDVIIASAYTGLSGELSFEIQSPWQSFPESFKANFTAKAFFEWNALFWSARNEWTFKNKTLYPRPSESALSLSQNDMQFIEPIKQSISTFSINNPNVFKENMQIYAKPTIINLGNGKLFMAYIDDSLNRTAENRSVLMYSVFDNGNWNTPQPVFDDGTSDFEPVILADGHGGVHILWQNANTTFDSNLTLKQMSQKMDLYYTHWNGVSFNGTTSITSNNQDYETSHKISTNGNNISIVWQQNSENDIFGTNGTNSIYRKQFINGVWKEVETISSNLSIINSLNTTYIDETNVVVYSTKTSNNTETLSDMELFYYNGINTMQITDNDVIDHSIQVLDDEIYWISNNSLVSISNGDINTKKTCIETLSSNLSNIKVISNASGDKAIVLEEENDLGMTFYVSNYDSELGSYGNIYPIAKGNGVVRGWNACFGSDNKIELAYCYADYLDEPTDNIPYGTLSLMQKSAESFCDISVNPIIKYSDEISANKEISLFAEITNSGSQEISQFSVTILDSNDNIIQSTMVDNKLGIGETAEIEIPFTLPSVICKMEYRINIQPIDANDIYTMDNDAYLSIGHADLCIENIEEIKTDSLHQLKITIKNDGYDSIDSSNIKISADSYSGTLLAFSTIETLLPGVETTYTFNLDSSYSDPNASDDPHLICIELETESDENNYENNKRSYYVYPDYSINVQTRTPGGTVIGTGIYAKDSTVQITAIPSEGYLFQGWYENNVRIDAEAVYAFSAVKSRTLEARFVPLDYCEIVAIDTESGVVDNESKFLRGMPERSDLSNYFSVTNNGYMCQIYNNNYSSMNATGVQVLLLSENGTLIDTYTIVILGDINGDSVIDAFDVIMLDIYIHGGIELDGAYLEACDMNQDGIVDETDYTICRNYVMGIRT